MKTSKLITWSIIGLMAFYACKTKKIYTKEIISIDEFATLARENNYSDTICYIFSLKDIANINISSGCNIHLEENHMYTEVDLQFLIELNCNEKAKDEYIQLVEQNCRKTTKSEYINTNTAYYLQALETGEPIDMGLANYLIKTSLVKVDSIPDEIENLFKDYYIFQMIKESHGGYGNQKTKELTTIREGELIPLSKLFNYAYAKNGGNLNLKLSEKIKILFTLIFGLDRKFTITQINKVKDSETKKKQGWNHEVLINVGNITAKYGIRIQSPQITSVFLISNNKISSICSPLIIECKDF